MFQKPALKCNSGLVQHHNFEEGLLVYYLCSHQISTIMSECLFFACLSAPCFSIFLKPIIQLIRTKLEVSWFSTGLFQETCLLPYEMNGVLISILKLPAELNVLDWYQSAPYCLISDRLLLVIAASSQFWSFAVVLILQTGESVTRDSISPLLVFWVTTMIARTYPGTDIPDLTDS